MERKIINLDPILKAVPSVKGCRGCIGYDNCKEITKIANKQEGLETCTGKKIIYIEV